MKSEPPIAHHCHVLADGTVIPDPGYEGPLTVKGPFRGSCAFEWLPERGTEPHERTRGVDRCGLPGHHILLAGKRRN